MNQLLITCEKNAIVPSRGTIGAAGYDLSAFISEEVVIPANTRKLFPTGIKMIIPTNMYGRIAPRSGLAYKHGIDVLAGVIDSDYRGDIGVILLNTGDTPFVVKPGDRIAQIIFETCHVFELTTVDSLDESARGASGYGSTGV